VVKKGVMPVQPASRLVLNITLEHSWMLDKQEQVMSDLLRLLQRYPPGTYQVGVHAHRYTKGCSQFWAYDSVALKQPTNIMVGFPFYIGQVVKR